MNPTPLIGEFVVLRPFPAVVSGAHIRELRERAFVDETPTPVQEFLSGFLAFDARSNHALEQLIGSLSQPKTGGAFWINGVYGTGKSHLLGVLTLLCDAPNRTDSSTITDAFTAHFPAFRARVESFPKRLVVFVSLDDYSAAQFSLEEVFWRELEQQWKRRDLGEWNISREGSRAESFAELEDLLRRRNLGGLVVLFDEMSLFLAAREPRELQGDASFLQFLAQHARRTSDCPLHLVAALQKTIEDIGPLEAYSLGQIRDRFVTLPLSLSHLPALVERRLIEPRDESALDEWCKASFQTLNEALPRLDFGPQEWRALFPFHPATIALLERVTGRFFSRTRSAALFCTHHFQANSPAENRVGSDAIWDYFAPDLDAHPDLRPLLEIASSWDSLVDEIGGRDVETLRRTTKWLLVCRVAGLAATPVSLANALGFDVGLGGESSYEYARQLLEKLRRAAPFLALERAEDPLLNRYVVDAGKRVGELARRHVSGLAESLAPGDSRLVAGAIRVCRADPFPLANLAEGRSFSIFWHHSPRQIAVGLWDGASAGSLANRVLAAREIGSRDDAFLLLLPPFEREEFEVQTVSSMLVDERMKAAFWVWKPREAARDEWDAAREVAASHLAAGDPALLDNRRGRALLEWLQKEAPALETALSRVVARLYLEGELVLGNGAALEASELSRGESFAALLESVADFALGHVFPRFAQIAPRARSLTPSNADTLCLELLRRPVDEGFAPSLERLARHIGEPLGIARASSGRWKMAPGDADLVESVKAEIGDGAPFGTLEARLNKGDWGLPPEMTALTVAAQLRAGELTAFDAQGRELAPAQIGLPLRRGVHLLRAGRLPESSVWTALAVLSRELELQRVGAPGFAEAARIAGELANWRDELAQSLDLARARSAQLKRALRHDSASWPQFEATCQTLGAVLERLSGAASGELLARAATLNATEIGAAKRVFHDFESRLETRLSPLLAAHALLVAPDLAPPPELVDERNTLLERFGAGEDVLRDDDLIPSGARWSESYATLYAAWHRAQHDPARLISLRRLAHSDALRALERLGALNNRRFETGAQVRETIEAELERNCSRDGTLERGSATCAACGLRLGERLKCADARELQTLVDEALKQFKSVVDESPVRPTLERANNALLEWDGASETLEPLLSAPALRELDAALAPRRRVSRSLSELELELQKCRTRAECEATFRIWLDGGEGLVDEDEIEWI